MNMSKLRALIIAFFGMVALLAPQAQAETQAWPQRPVKFLVPFGRRATVDGGGGPRARRVTAGGGKAVVIENRPGADGLVAIQAFLAANDGHTLRGWPT